MISDMSRINKSEDYDNRKLGENRYRLYEALKILEDNKSALDSIYAQIQVLNALNVTSGEIRDKYFNRLSEVEKATDFITGTINRFFDNETQHGE